MGIFYLIQPWVHACAQRATTTQRLQLLACHASGKHPATFRQMQRRDAPSATPCGGKSAPPYPVAVCNTCYFLFFPPGYFWQIVSKGIICDNTTQQGIIFVKKSTFYALHVERLYHLVVVDSINASHYPCYVLLIRHIYSRMSIVLQASSRPWFLTRSL
jgi:hypothetical protein